MFYGLLLHENCSEKISCVNLWLCFLSAYYLEPQKDWTSTWRFLLQFQGILISWRSLHKSYGLTEPQFPHL